MNVLTLEDVARMFRVKKQTVRRWTAAGVFPAPLRLPKRGVLRWNAADVEVFLKSK